MNSRCRDSSIATSTGCGSLTLTIISASAKTVGRVGNDRRALLAVGVVRDRRAESRALLDVDLVAGVRELTHARGCQRDPVLVDLDLARNPNLHAAHLALE